MKKISIVATVYNDCNIVEVFVQRIQKIVHNLPYQTEIILVNDASTDGSWSVIQKLCKQNKAIKGVLLSRNKGQQIAMSVGLHFAQGEYVIIMDGDLQNPPEAIIEILQKLEEGNEVVYTVSMARNSKKDSWLSQIFWLILTKLFHLKIVSNQLMMKGFSKRAVDCYNSYKENIRTVAGIVHDFGLKSCSIAVVNNTRFSGKSHHSIFHRINLSIDMLLTLTSAPLNILIYLGIAGFFLSIILIVRSIITYFLVAQISGYTSLFSLVALFGSINILILGIVGRYLSNIYQEVRDRPLYFVDQMLNINQLSIMQNKSSKSEAFDEVVMVGES